ncbi:hypothetical protein IH799_02875 [candidate division KSB1 bacterium]|nr:hypothetical protein [candidate division KSB1 bacterium]
MLDDHRSVTALLFGVILSMIAIMPENHNTPFVGTPRPGIERVSKEKEQTKMAKYWFDITVWSGNRAIATKPFYGTADGANDAGAATASSTVHDRSRPIRMIQQKRSEYGVLGL